MPTGEMPPRDRIRCRTARSPQSGLVGNNRETSQMLALEGLAGVDSAGIFPSGSSSSSGIATECALKTASPKQSWSMSESGRRIRMPRGLSRRVKWRCYANCERERVLRRTSLTCIILRADTDAPCERYSDEERAVIKTLRVVLLCGLFFVPCFVFARILQPH